MKNVVALTVLVALASLQLAGCAAAVVAGAATGAVVVHDRRTAGRFVDDQTLEITAGARIRDDESLKDVRVNVTSMNGIVLLTGEAPAPELRNQVLTHVRSVEGVRRIYNYIRVAPAADADTAAQDLWLKTKIKTKQTTAKGIDPTAVKVVISDSVVYLMGLVTREEATRATKLVRSQKGVKKVVKLFEYTD